MPEVDEGAGLSKNPFPEDARGEEVCLGAALLGDSLLLANSEPTDLSKKPPPEEALVGEDCLGASADFLGDSLLLANWEPTELSKKPPPEEALVGEDCLGAAFSGALDPLVDWAATLIRVPGLAWHGVAESFWSLSSPNRSWGCLTCCSIGCFNSGNSCCSLETKLRPTSCSVTEQCQY